jgi:flagellin
MAMGISLTNGMRNALYSLSDLQGQIESTNKRLATGKKVNSALDNALNYFTAQGLSDRANALNVILDNIGLGIKIHQNADKALTSMKGLLENAEGQMRQALQSTGQNTKAVTNYSFTGASDIFGEVAAGTNTRRMQAGDAITIQLTSYNAINNTYTNVGAAVNITVNATDTLTTVIANINSNLTLNPAGQEQRVYASLNDANQLVLEAVAGNTETAILGFDLTATNNAGAASNVLDVFSVTGKANEAAAVSVVGPAQTARIASAVNQTRSSVASGFRELLTQVTNLARDAGYNGTNLLNGDSLRVGFNEDDTTAITTRGVRYEATGLGFILDSSVTFQGDALYSFQSEGEIKAGMAKIKAAKALVEAQQRFFANNFNILQNRLDFSKNVTRNLKEGSDLLTLADANEEGASLASLQTRQQLSVTALSLANQSDQAILRLF